MGCGVIIESQGAQITGVRGDPEHPANFGRLCSKGSTLHLTATAAVTQQARLLQPLRRASRGATPQPVSWDTALDEATERFASIIETHGPDAVGLYLSGQMLTEDYYVFNKLAKGLIGTNNVDTNSRLCMSSAVAGYKATLGADAPPACYDDLALAQHACSSPARTWPGRTRCCSAGWKTRARANPAQKWIVVDPRRTETAALADLHLQLLPGSDVALFHGLLHLMLWEGLGDSAFIAAHTTGIEALRDRVREFTPKHVAQLCGLKEADIVQAARWFGANTPTLSLYCQGLNQSRSGTDKNAALINLHLATGQIGKPGAGPVLADRPAQRDGRARGRRAGQPAERAPRPGQCAAPRRGGRAVGRRRRAGQAGQERGGDVPGRGRRRDPRAVDRLHQPGAVDARPGHRAARAANAASSSCVQEAFATHRHRALRRPAAARHHLGREGRHRHQQRAPHQPRAPRGAAAGRGARTTGPSASTSRAGWNAGWARPAACSPMPTPKRCGTNTATAHAAATSTSPA